MEKYQRLFLDQNQQRLRNWLTGEEDVSEKELYQFLHMVKGTGAQIGLGNWASIAEKLEQEVDPDGMKIWPKTTLYHFLQPFIVLLDADSVDEESKYEWVDSQAEERQQEKPLIFVIDDDVVLLQYVREQLEQEGFMVMLATSYKDKTVQHFYRWKPDCILIDVHLPEKDGFHILDMLEQQADAYHVPVFMMSGHDSAEQRMKVFQSADAFVKKPINMEEMIIRLKRVIARRKKMLELILTDSLTGAFNHRYALNEISRRLDLQRDNQESFCLGAIDINGFRSINEQHGYLKGNQLLQHMYDYIQEQIKTYDVIVRFEADSFLILFSHTALQEAKRILEKMIDGFPEMVREKAGKEMEATVSASLIEIQHPDVSPKECIRKLDSTIHGGTERKPGQLHIIKWGEQVRKKIVRLAVIDDDPIICRMLEAQLSDLGGADFETELRTYGNGEQFFADPWHKEHDQYLLILDGVMPRMDGLEVIKKLRSSADKRKYTIMMLTNRRGEQDVATAIQQGADDYLKKPFGMEELRARIKRLIRGSS
ncbi:response regulator [Bacillus sp. FJAT-27251]|uniref:GGDEF domain-containing response regulator n=1 Tax=Bacillus sp. FJAT-27251 TaxID=1684142 RepID=UPI001E375022|nr:response regulator [Bacillus sp. FJAT-27251]